MARLIKIMALCFVLTTRCAAQTFNTPEVSSIKQEVFRPFSYYTGQANISIPLTQVQTSEITVPITLNYVGGAGLQPINPYSSVGMGWRVSAGGAITRTKNGLCDEASGGTLNGFFSLPPNSVNPSDVRNNVSSYFNDPGNGQPPYFTSTVEYSPDVFSFSFLGYSGYFIMGYDGQFKIQSQDIASVEKLSSTNSPTTISFKLTANDGTVFSFGDTNGSTELSGGEGGAPFQTDAWYLTEIRSVNERVVKFNYHPNNQTFVRFNPSSEATTASTNSPVVLDNIVFNGGKVLFTSFTVSQNIGGPPSNARMINKIELKDSDNNVVSSSDFTYGSEKLDRYYFLNSLVVNGKSYAFTYHEKENLPSLTESWGTDYWGFYNSRDEVQNSAVTNTFWDNYLNPRVNYEPRNPSLASTKIGVLTSIAYPAGGVESYEYELNTYLHVGKQGSNGRYYESLETGPPQTAGGLRVSKITLGDVVRKYRYVQVFDPNNPDYTANSSPINFLSSGILYRLPGVPSLGNSVATALSIDGEPAVVYSKVIEYLSDKSYTEYRLRSPLEYTDRSNTGNSGNYFTWFTKPSITNGFPVTGFVGNLGKSSSTSLERGQVSQMKVFDAGNNLKKKVAYTYATDPNRFNQNVPVLNTKGTDDQALARLAFLLGHNIAGSLDFFSIVNSFEVYTYPVYLEKEVETTYEPGGEMEKTTEYVYNAQKLRSQISFTNSIGATIKTKIRYPADINAGVYSSMVSKKMLNFPIEQIQLKDNLVTGSGLTTYKALSNFYVPDKKYTLGIATAFSESNFGNYNGTTMDSRYPPTPDISYDHQSDQGNVRQTTTRDGIITSYLWDALGVYPKAQVNGAGYSSINSQEGKTANYSSSALHSSLKALVPSALITTYSYKPLYGIESATNPAGKVTWYTYDNFARLSNIRENDSGGSLIKSFHYNYANQGGWNGGIEDNPAVSTPTDLGLIGNENCPKPSLSGGGTVCAANSQTVVLTASGSSGTVTWYKDGTEILSGSSNTYTVTAPGAYTATRTVDNCVSAVSDAVNIQQTNGCNQAVCTSPRNPENPSSTSAGLTYKYYELPSNIDGSAVNQLSGLTPFKTGTVSNFSLGEKTRDEKFGFEFSGYLDVPQEGEYTFYLRSDDASTFLIGSQAVVSYEGLHGMDPEHTGTICLKAGKHAIKAILLQGQGGFGLELRWSGPGISKQLIADNRLSYTSTANCGGTGYATLKRWNGIGNGNSIADLMSQTNNLTNTPSSISNVTSLQTPTDVAESYGQQIQGYITAPQTGTYYFWISSDDHSQLWLSSSNDPGNKQQIAYVNGSTSPQSWSTQANQKSGAINLVGCTQYYFEVLHKEGVGGDNLAIGWSKPTEAASSPSQIIPGSVLSPYNGSVCSTPTPSISSPGTTVCAASNQSVILTASGSGGTVTWYKDGNQIASGSSNTYTVTAPGSYTATRTDNCTSSISTAVNIQQSSGCGGGGCVVNKVRLYFRTNCCAERLNGATIWGLANNATTWTQLFTINGNAIPGSWQEFSFANTTQYSAVRYNAGPNGFGELLEIEFYNGNTKLTGTQFGNTDVFQGNGLLTYTNVFDGQLGEMWHGANQGFGNYVGLNLTGCGSGGCTTPPAPTVSAAQIGTSSSYQLTASCSSGSLTWSHGLGNSSPVTVSPSSTTTYTATCTVEGTCSSTSNVTVTVSGSGGQVCSSEYLANYGNSSESYTYNLNVGTAGTYTVKVNYRFNEGSAATGGVKVNGGATQTLSFPNTAGNYQDVSFTATLVAGANTIMIFGGNTGYFGTKKVCAESGGSVCTTPAAPTASISSEATTVCAANNQSVTLTATGSGSITWYKNGVQVGTPGNSSYVTTETGQYTATATTTGSNGVCVSSVSNTVTISQASNCGGSTGGDCITLSPASHQSLRLSNENGVTNMRNADGSNSQIWKLGFHDTGYWDIISQGSTNGVGIGYVLGVAGQGSTAGNEVQLQGGVNGDHQLWQASALTNGDPGWRKFVRKGTTLRIGSRHNWGAGDASTAQGATVNASESDLALFEDPNDDFGAYKWVMNSVGCPGTTPSCNFTASISATNNNPSPGLGVTLTAGCSGADCNSLTYSWTGAGTNGTANTTSFSAPSSGFYTYTVTISRSGCDSKSASITLNVQNSTPTGCYTLAPASFPNLRLANEDGVTNIRNSDGSDSQIWKIYAETGNQSFFSKIIARGSTTGARIGMVLGVRFQGITNGDVIELQDNIFPGPAGEWSEPADHQLWDPGMIPDADISWRKFVRKGTPAGSSLRLGSKYNWGAGDASTAAGSTINPFESDLVLANDPSNSFGSNIWIISSAVCPNN